MKKILRKIFGRKYYANIVNLRGTDAMELCCFIFKEHADADAHRYLLDETRTFQFVETISFRSRKDY